MVASTSKAESVEIDEDEGKVIKIDPKRIRPFTHQIRKRFRDIPGLMANVGFAPVRYSTSRSRRGSRKKSALFSSNEKHQYRQIPVVSRMTAWKLLCIAKHSRTNTE